MAKSDIEVTVNVDVVVHERFGELAQEIYDRYGIRVTEARIDWLNVSRMDGDDHLVEGVKLQTRRASGCRKRAAEGDDGT